MAQLSIHILERKTFRHKGRTAQANSAAAHAVSDAIVDHVWLASKVNHKNQCTNVVPYESVCEIYVPQALLVLSLPNVEQKKSFIVG
jgi:hypothetical protein